MKSKVDHTTFRNGDLFCSHCGGKQELPLPMQVEMLDAMIGAFNKIHKSCKPVWKQPEVNQNLSVSQRANWWWNNGERGASSETMWYCLADRIKRREHPHDPDDFKRCYKLLKVIPEWKNELHKLKEISDVWARLVENWGKLTEMYEDNERNQWKTFKEIGMYEFMQSLIKGEFSHHKG